jgi:hypothetical protein
MSNAGSAISTVSIGFESTDFVSLHGFQDMSLDDTQEYMILRAYMIRDVLAT